jgi:hypothetical protein
MSDSKLDINVVWEQFHTWSDRYIAKCDAEIERLYRKGDGLFRDTQFMTERIWDDWDHDDVDVATRKEIIRKKAVFLKIYFRDLSFDGTAYMKRHMRLLPMQLPLRNRTGIGIWLEQDQERKQTPIHATTEFLEPYVALFAKDVADIDFASAHSVLPFDYLSLRNFTGKKWSKVDARRIARQIKDDLEFDGMEFDMNSRSTQAGLDLTFIWDPTDPPTEKDEPLATKKAVKKITKKAAKKTSTKKLVAKRASPKQKVARVRGARRDASIESITKRIEKAFKLPEGSVKLLLPSGKKAHLDGRIKNLLSQWDNA